MPHFGPVAVADLNHDGYLDLVQARDPDANITQQALDVAGGPFITPAIAIYLGGPGGTFTKSATFAVPGIQLPTFEPALIGDFNGDGVTDVALPQFRQQLEDRGSGASRSFKELETAPLPQTESLTNFRPTIYR